MLFSGCVIWAQSVDSIAVSSNPFYQYLFQEQWNNPIFAQKITFQDFTETTLNIDYRELNLKRVQTPESVVKYTFATNGLYQISPKTRIFGSFNFQRFNEKEIGYNLSTQRTEDVNVLSPHYFLVPRKGNWENQKYQLQGGATHSFENGITLSGKIFYEAANYFRTNDPRPEIIQNFYGGEAAAGYTFQNHTLNASAGWSRNRNKGSILYVDDTQNAPAYSETFTRFSSGYGRVVFNGSARTYIFNDIANLFGAGYTFAKNNTILGVNYNYSKNLEGFYTINAGNALVAIVDDRYKELIYRNIKNKISVNFLQNNSVYKYKTKLFFQQEDGDNYSVRERGQNFKSAISTFGFNAGILKQAEKRVLFSAEINAQVADHRYQDLLGSTDKKLQAFEGGISLNRDLIFTSKGKFNVAIETSFYKALSEGLQAVSLTSDNAFLQNVVLPDQGFDVTSKIKTALNLAYFVNLPKNRMLRFHANFGTLHAVDKAYEKYVADLNTQGNFYCNAGFSIIY